MDFSVSRGLYHAINMNSTPTSLVATGQEMVRGKTILQGQGNVREFYSGSDKIGIFKKNQGKLKL